MEREVSSQAPYVGLCQACGFISSSFTSQKTLQPLDVSRVQELKTCVSRAVMGGFPMQPRQEAPSFHWHYFHSLLVAPNWESGPRVGPRPSSSGAGAHASAVGHLVRTFVKLEAGLHTSCCPAVGPVSGCGQFRAGRDVRLTLSSCS